MGYRLEWRLVARGDRVLDSGEIDNGFPDHQTALQALDAILRRFPVSGRNDDDNGWWLQRSPDSDLRVLLSVEG